MTRAIILAALILAGMAAPARADDLPCKSHNLAHTTRCLSHMRGLQAGTQQALKVLRCEGGATHYIGPWSLLRAEAKVFPHQGPAWSDRIIRQHPQWSLANGYRQTIGVLAHGQRFGWSWSSCAA